MKRNFLNYVTASVLVLMVLVGVKGWGQVISENFQTWTTKTTYGSINQSGSGGTWTGTALIVSPSAVASGTGSKGLVQFQSVNGILTIPNIASGGVGTITIQAKVSGASGGFKFEKNVNGGGWSDIQTFTTSSTSVIQFQSTVNDASSNIQIRINNTGGSSGRSLYVYDVVITSAPVSSYTVTYNGNGSTGGSMSSQTASSPTALTSNAFNRTGYTFINWNTSSDGTGATYTNGQSYGFGANITLYAQWAINSYNVTYDGNGNTGGSVPGVQSGNYNSSVSLASNSGSLTKTGYTFNGWNSLANGLGTHYNEGVSFTIPASNTTLYAEWLTAEPTNHPTSFSATANSSSQITVNWNDNDGSQTASGFLVLANTSGTFTDPVDGTAQSDAAMVKNISHGTQTAVFSGLSGSTTYYFKVFAYNGSGSSINYKTDGSVPTTNATTSASATLSATSLTDFGSNCINSTYGPNSFTITGTTLTSANVTVSSLTGFTFSTSSGGTYTSSLSLSQVGGSYSQDIYVKFSPSLAQSYNGNIVVGGGGANSINVAATGTGINTAPTVTTTSPATNLTFNTATCDGNVTSAGCQTITERGICYSTSSNPTTADSKVTSAGSTGTFSCNLSGLTSSTTYHYRAYAISSAGTGYGVDQSFSTSVFSAPVATSATTITQTEFTAHWGAVAGASSYKIDVYTQTAVNAKDLFISEYVEGSSSNKYIEIFNGTGASVDLSNYNLQLYANGSPSTINDVALSGTLANNSVIVYKNSSAALSLPNGVTATANAAVNFNGNDAVALYNTTTNSFADIFGRIGDDPDTYWSSTSNSTVNKTLVRNSSVIEGITTSPTGTGSNAFTTLESEWTQSNIDVVSNIGSHTFNGLSNNYLIQDASTTSTSYDLTSVDPGTVYYYVIRAYDGNQSSLSSNIIKLCTRPNPVSSVSMSPGTNNLTITWNRGNGAGVLVKISDAPFVVGSRPIDDTNYSSLCNTTYSGSGEQWVYDGTGTSVTVNLPNAYDVTLLNVAIFEYSTFDDGSKAINKIYNQGIIEDYNGDGGFLPVQLVEFKAVSSDNVIELNWKTASEINNDYFILEKSTDGKTFEFVSTIRGNGNSNVMNKYQQTDNQPYMGNNYYRLTQVDFDGKMNLCGLIVVDFNNNLKSNVWVNQNRVLTLEYNSEENLLSKLEVINSIGQVVYSKTFEINSNNQIYNFNLSELKSGLYTIRFTGNKTIILRKIFF